MADKEIKKELEINLKKPTTEDDQTAKIPKPPKSVDTDEKKVVLNSGTDSAIRPSDATRMAPAVVPPQKSEETATLNKKDVQEAVPKPPAPVSKEAKGTTIKLKPLKPISAEEDSDAEETLSMERDKLLEGDMPSSLGATAAPAAAPPVAPAVQATHVTPGSIDEEDTIKIQKPTTTKPAHPTPTIPGAKETIKLRPSNTTTPPPAVGQGGSDNSEDQETVSMSKKTIRLVPKKQEQTVSDATQKTAKPSAPTVKLTDSKGPAPTVVPTAPAAPTSPAVAPTPAKPSAPTVKLPEPSAGAGAPAATSGKRTLKLKSSAKTVAVPPPEVATETGQEPAAPGTETDAASAADPKTVKSPDEKGANPNIIFTIAALFTLILIAYYAWMSVGSWAEVYQDVKTTNVPGLSGTVKSPK